MASPNISEILTTTLESRSGVLADNVSENNAILSQLSKKGKIKTFSGGTSIYQELEYAENSTYKRYSGYESLNISPSDVISAAEFGIKQAAVAISISGLEELQNSGKERIIDLIEARVGNGERTMKNNIAADMYSAGTADGGKQIGGLQSLIAAAPTTGTVGGIDRAAFSFWQSQLLDASVEGAAVSATNIRSYLNKLWLRCTRGTDSPNLILADNNYFTFYWDSLQAIQRITDASKGESGFMTLDYMGAPFMFDGGHGGNCPASTLYMLNTNYIHWRPHAKRNMVPLNPDRYATNQDAVVKLIGFAGNMTMSNAFVQGTMHE